MYADNTQVLLDLRGAPNYPHPFLECFRATKTWMNENYQCLKESELENMWLGNPPLDSLSRILPRDMGPPPDLVHEVRNLGCILDSQLNFKKQICAATQAASFKLRTLRRVLPLFNLAECKQLVTALARSHLDYACSICMYVFELLYCTHHP